MSKQPYIPLYIGDWQKDTNTISLEAEGALLKLVFKLWDAKERGQLSISLNQLSILLKKGRELTEKILLELKENEVLNIEFEKADSVKIESRRMLKDAAKSRAASENGRKGGRPQKAKRKLNESKSKAKPKLNTDNDSDNDIAIEVDNDSATVTVISDGDFEFFWNEYDKKVGDKEKLKKKWGGLTLQEKKAALEYIPHYKAAQPEKKYRKNPETFLNNKSWNDEIITSKTNSHQPNALELATEALRYLNESQNRNHAAGG